MHNLLEAWNELVTGSPNCQWLIVTMNTANKACMSKELSVEL